MTYTEDLEKQNEELRQKLAEAENLNVQFTNIMVEIISKAPPCDKTPYMFSHTFELAKPNVASVEELTDPIEIAIFNAAKRWDEHHEKMKVEQSEKMPHADSVYPIKKSSFAEYKAAFLDKRTNIDKLL